MAENYLLDLPRHAAEFVAGNESQHQRGRIGDRGRAIGYYQFGLEHGFQEFFEGLTAYEQDSMLPDKPRRGQIFSGKTKPSKAEYSSIQKYMTSPIGEAKEDRHFQNAYQFPAWQAAVSHSPDPDPSPEMLALMTDMFTQRGKGRMLNEVLPGLGRTDAGGLVDHEISKLDYSKNPGGSAIILDRRVDGAHRLGVNINPQKVYRAVLEIIKSPRWDRMQPNEQKATLAKLKRTMRATMARYTPTAGATLKRLNNLRDMIDIERDPEKDLEVLGGLD